MKSTDVTPGQVYTCRITGRVVHALVIRRLPSGPWHVRNLRTNRLATVSSSRRFGALVDRENVLVGLWA